MILDYGQLSDIILNNPNKALVKKAKDYNSRLKLHIYGGKNAINQHFTQIDGFEKPTLRDLRVKYAQSNKDLFARLSRPIDKVFSAKGGSTYYNLPQEQDKKARLLALDIKSGYSIKKWVENFWKVHYMDDPGGLIFMEIASLAEATRLNQQGKSFVYPTYKSISTVFDYLPNGSNLEYVVFELSADEKIKEGLKQDDIIYRVVDDAFDYLVKRDDKTVIILNTFTLPNYFMQVPALINSDLPDPNTDGLMISVFDQILELAESFLLKGSIKVTHDFLHAFPKYWQYASDCNDCRGTGYQNGDICPTCNGTRKRPITKVSDSMLLDFPDKDSIKVTPDVAGYVSPDRNYYDIATTELQTLEDLMAYTLWGSATHQRVQGINSDPASIKTATEIVQEIKPQADRLSAISEAAEKRHKFILDAIIKIQINQNYQGSSVSYGKRYLLEGPDEIKDKYLDAKTKQASTSILDNLYLQFLDAEYSTDEVKLTIEKKKFLLKPFFHEDVSQDMVISDVDKVANKYFEEWVKVNTNDAMLLSMSVESLRLMLYTYAEEKATTLNQQKEADLALQQKYTQKPAIAA
jgi:hypothetical protein